MGTRQIPTNTQWRKSSYSGTSGGECVEVADLAPHIAIRDSKAPDGPVLTLPADSFARFVGAAVRGEI